MSKRARRFSPCFLLLAAVLAGGCSDDGAAPTNPSVAGSVSSTQPFSLSAVRANIILRGYLLDCVITGTAAGLPATGEERIMLAGPEAVTFEGQAGSLKNALTEVGSITIAGRPQGINTLLSLVWSSNYVPLGAIAGSGEYWLVREAPKAQPEVRVGDLLNKVVYTVYGNSQKILTKGRVEIGGSIDADTAATAILTEVWTTYNIANTIEKTETFRFRIDRQGNAALISKSLVLNNAPNDSTICKFG